MTELDFSQLDAFGNIRSVYDAEALALRLKQKLLLERGEWFLDATAGVPYRESIITKPMDLGLAVTILNKVLTDDPDVMGLNTVSANINSVTRRMSYSASVRSIYGEAEVVI